MSGPTLPASPYKGLVPYSEEDAPFFFGREAEREIILANLMASRLTLLYGASGVGKSSVLRAGVAHHLRQTAREEVEEGRRPEFLVVVFNSWKDDPVAALLECVRSSAAKVLGEEVPPAAAPGGSLAEALHAWTERLGSELLIILDQFEECFLYHGRDDGLGTFAAEFPAAVNRPDLRASFLVSIREDAVAKLDRFKGRIPNLFDNYLRIEHLGREPARDAIEKPLQRFNELRGKDGEEVTIEPALVNAVLDQLQTGRLALGETGRGGVQATSGGADGAPRIETPFLQLVMTRLWEKEMQSGSRVLRLSTLEELGGAQRIVRTHLDKVMDALPAEEQDAASRIFHFLVTPSGTKIAHAPADLADYTDLPASRIEQVLATLSKGEMRILRSDAGRYEIFHDVLAPAILDWRRRYLERQRQAEIQRQAQDRQAELERAARRRGRFLVGWLAAMVVIAGFAVYSWYNANEEKDDIASESELIVASYNADAPTHTPLGLAPGQDSLARRLVTQLASASDDRAGREEVLVRYFQPQVLEPKGIVDKLKAQGFRVESAEGRFTAPPNAIAYGRNVRLADLELVALTLVSAGLPIQRIYHFPAERGRSNVMEVVHLPVAVGDPPLTVDGIRSKTRIPRDAQIP